MVEIPNSSIDRIIRKAGAQRVSKSAIAALRSELEDYGIEISKFAIEIANYADKRTIDGADIALALRKRKFLELY